MRFSNFKESTGTILKTPRVLFKDGQCQDHTIDWTRDMHSVQMVSCVHIKKWILINGSGRNRDAFEILTTNLANTAPQRGIEFDAPKIINLSGTYFFICMYLCTNGMECCPAELNETIGAMRIFLLLYDSPIRRWFVNAPSSYKNKFNVPISFVCIYV